MSKVKFELIANNGTYKDREGNEKKRWHKCGVVIESDKGTYAKIESLPVGFDGWLKMSEPKDRQPVAPKKDPKDLSDMSSDVPF